MLCKVTYFRNTVSCHLVHLFYHEKYCKNYVHSIILLTILRKSVICSILDMKCFLILCWWQDFFTGALCHCAPVIVTLAVVTLNSCMESHQTNIIDSVKKICKIIVTILKQNCIHSFGKMRREQSRTKLLNLLVIC